LLIELVLDDVIDVLMDDVDVPDFEKLGLLEPDDEIEEVFDSRFVAVSDTVPVEVLEPLELPVILLLLVIEPLRVPDDVELREPLGGVDKLGVVDELLLERTLLVELELIKGVIVPPGDALSDRLEVPVFVEDADDVPERDEL